MVRLVPCWVGASWRNLSRSRTRIFLNITFLVFTPKNIEGLWYLMLCSHHNQLLQCPWTEWAKISYPSFICRKTWMNLHTASQSTALSIHYVCTRTSVDRTKNTSVPFHNKNGIVILETESISNCGTLFTCIIIAHAKKTSVTVSKGAAVWNTPYLSSSIFGSARPIKFDFSWSMLQQLIVYIYASSSLSLVLWR